MRVEVGDGDGDDVDVREVVGDGDDVRVEVGDGDGDDVDVRLYLIQIYHDKVKLSFQLPKTDVDKDCLSINKKKFYDNYLVSHLFQNLIFFSTK